MADADREIGERAAVVDIELQPRPPVPEHCVPYWWGNGVLTFREPTGQVVGEGQFEHAFEGFCRVEKRDGFGWVIVLTLRHEQADAALARLGLPRTVDGRPESRWSYWPIDLQHNQPPTGESTMTQEEANVVLALAEAEKAKAHARLMNAQAEQMENENQLKDSAPAS